MMRLDDEFSGPPDPSRLTKIQTEQPPADPMILGASSTFETRDLIAAPRRLVGQGNQFIEAVQAARADPNLSPTEQRAAMIEVLKRNLGPGATIHVAQDGSIDATSISIGSPSVVRHSLRDVRAAVQ